MTVSNASPSAAARLFSSPVLALIWFGAAVSLAEILTGTFFAPLGLAYGAAAILLGHLIGGAMFFLVALASARTGTSAMETAGRAFGRAGRVAFSTANAVQLLGWTAIMVASGAAAAASLVPQIGLAGWCLAIGALIVVWIAIGPAHMSRVQSVAAIALFALTLIASAAVFGKSAAGAPTGDVMAFGAAVELAAAMPLSWLPVAGDYTRDARAPLAGSAAAALAYTIGSCWMFFIGLGMALFAGSSDFAEVLAVSGLGLVGIFVVVFSTVTTTFLDAQSTGMSAHAISGRIPAKAAGIIAAIVGTILAICTPVNDFESFLYLIGSVFAPMAAIVCVDALVLHNDSSAEMLSPSNAVLWLAGFVLYRISLGWSLPCGNTFPVIVVIAAATLAVHKLLGK
jgi:putative hydroxymethylpyrimidine transporter CytX